jgi:hypothetical protein
MQQTEPNPNETPHPEPINLAELAAAIRDLQQALKDINEALFLELPPDGNG